MGCIIIHRITQNKLNVLAPRITHGLDGKRPVQRGTGFARCIVTQISQMTQIFHRITPRNPMKKIDEKKRKRGCAFDF